MERPASVDGDLTMARVLERLRLAPHPEGGFYRETYRSPVRVPTPRGERSAMTSIYFLLPADTVSVFHRVLSDEVWTHSSGGELALHVIAPDGAHNVIQLGAGAHAVVPAGHWQAARPVQTRYALVTCVVAPGFEFEDFEIARRGELARAFPGLPDDVLKLAMP